MYPQDLYKCKSFQGPKAGPGPQPILAIFARLHFDASANSQKNFLLPPFTNSSARYLVAQLSRRQAHILLNSLNYDRKRGYHFLGK